VVYATCQQQTFCIFVPIEHARQVRDWRLLRAVLGAVRRLQVELHSALGSFHSAVSELQSEVYGDESEEAKADNNSALAATRHASLRHEIEQCQEALHLSAEQFTKLADGGRLEEQAQALLDLQGETTRQIRELETTIQEQAAQVSAESLNAVYALRSELEEHVMALRGVQEAVTAVQQKNQQLDSTLDAVKEETDEHAEELVELRLAAELQSAALMDGMALAREENARKAFREADNDRSGICT
jgi:hypothetical protein